MGPGRARPDRCGFGVVPGGSGGAGPVRAPYSAGHPWPAGDGWAGLHRRHPAPAEARRVRAPISWQFGDAAGRHVTKCAVYRVFRYAWPWGAIEIGVETRFTRSSPAKMPGRRSPRGRRREAPASVAPGRQPPAHPPAKAVWTGPFGPTGRGAKRPVNTSATSADIDCASCLGTEHEPHRSTPASRTPGSARRRGRPGVRI